MRKLRERWIERDFVSTQVVVVVDRASLHGGEVSGAQQRGSVVFPYNFQADRSGYDAFDAVGELAGHVMSERDQRFLLNCAGVIIHDHHGSGGVGIRVRITERGFRAHHGNYCQSVQRYAVPLTLFYAPSHNRFIADEVDFAIGKALAGVNVGTARFDVVTLNLLAEGNRCERKQNKCGDRDTFHGVLPHEGASIVVQVDARAQRVALHEGVDYSVGYVEAARSIVLIVGTAAFLGSYFLATASAKCTRSV